MGCACSKKKGAVEGDGQTWAAPRGKGRPKLAELKRINVPGPDELGEAAAGFGKDSASDSRLRSGGSCLDILVKNTVLVAVRVRPQNQRERDAGSAECIKQEAVTNLVLQRDGERDCRFAFDCLLERQASQRDVFDRTGRPLLHKVLEGYNGCLFAYGQTGSGKTYTMQGADVGEHRGLIPLICADLFSEVQERKDSKNITVQCSLLEIYNEKVKDLLTPDGTDLQIREDASGGGRGVHVDGLSETVVQSCGDVLALLQKGQARRAVGQTNMNDQSSRSHAVVTLKIASCDCGDAEGVTLTVSKLHLIDLAGSERQKSTGATGDRLKEGAQINLSLSALGNVINALTDTKGGRHVPYRDSKLTRLLQDSLGGNSYTVMVCNISPAKINAEETMSSLRFAERAKKIENKAIVNRDPRNEHILQLMQTSKVQAAKILRLEAHVQRLEENY